MSNKVGWGDILLVAIGLVLSSSSYQSEQNESILYERREQEQSIIHTVTVESDRDFIVTPAVAKELQPITDFATEYEAIAVINGGYFDPNNQKTTSYLVKEGKLVADPRNNERLMENPDLNPYIDKILNRAEFRRYLCGEDMRYDITLHDTPVPTGCELQDALGGGPSLLPEDTAVEEGFVAYKDGEMIRNAIGTNSPNARSAVGIKENGDVVLSMVEQKPNVDGSGMSLPELADFLSTLGVTKAMNLDGGSSAALYYHQEETVYGKLDKEGNKIERPIKSVLLVK